jgi:hypothetical protein
VHIHANSTVAATAAAGGLGGSIVSAAYDTYWTKEISDNIYFIRRWRIKQKKMDVLPSLAIKLR